MKLPIKTNPWTILETKDGYKNPWIKLTHHKVINPGGEHGEYTTVHFKNEAVGIIALDEDLNTYLVGQYRFPIKRYSWEIPEGGSPENETALESAKRELSEETGLSAKSWELIQEFDISNSITDERAYIFLAKDLSVGEPNPDADEELETIKVPFKELYKKVLSGEIRDSLTVIATLKVQTLILENKL